MRVAARICPIWSADYRHVDAGSTQRTSVPSFALGCEPDTEMGRRGRVIVFPLLVVWLVIPPVLGWVIDWWLALAPALLFFPAFVVWHEVIRSSSATGEPVFETWFNYLLAFLFLSLPPLGLTAVAIAWRRWT